MIVVTGATGTVGREIVGRLLAQGRAVRALTRHPATARLPDAVETVRGAPSDEHTLTTALDGAEAVFLNVFGDAEPVTGALAAAVPSRVVLLSTQTAGSRPDLAEAARHRELEARLRAVRDDLVVLRPGQFMSNNLWWAPMIARGHVEAPFADVAIPTIDPVDVAAVATEALLDDRHAGTTPVLTGVEAPTPRERVDVIADVLGRRITFSEQSEQDFRDANPMVPTDMLDYMVAVMGYPAEDDRLLNGAVREITGVEPRRFREWVVHHRAEMLGQSRPGT